MKRKFSFFLVFIVFFACFISCSNSSSDEETIYKVEMGIVSKSTCNEAINKMSHWNRKDVTYSKIASIRLYLYNNTDSDYAVLNDVTIEEIEEFLFSHGMTKYEVKTEIELLETVGNNILFATHATDSEKMFWFYATK